MPQFEVTMRGDGWVEAECRELGVLITAKTFADVEETARRTAARAKKEAKFTYELRRGRLERVLLWIFGRSIANRSDEPSLGTRRPRR